MSVRVKQRIALFIAVIITMAGMQFITAPEAHAATISSVRKAIQELSADPTSYKASDRERIEMIWVEYNSLSAEDQEILDNESSHSDTSQPLGRVLEAVYWGVLSYDEVDNSTTLPDGTYDENTTPELSYMFNKGKSTSGKADWSITSVTVKDGKATATIAVNKESYPKIWIGGKEYEKTNTSGNSEFAGIAIDLNEDFYFAGISSSMPTPIAYSIKAVLEEPAQDDPPAKADYTAVDAAIASIPSDLSIYTDETVAAVNTAKDAVVRDKLATEQSEVDAMAKAINDAVKALVEKPADYTAVDAAIASIPSDLSIYTDETAAAVNTAKDAVVRGKTITAQSEVDAMAKAITDAVNALVKKEEPKPDDPVLADYTAVDAAIASIPADLSIYTEKTAAAVNTAKDAVVRDKLATEQSEVDAMAKAIDDAVKALVEKPADYTAVDTAIASIPADMSIYTDETAAAVNAAKDAVVRDKTITAQPEVDAMAKAIEDAVKALIEKLADYTAVDAAIAAIPADMSIYTDETVAAVYAAKDAVVRDMTITAQAEVDAMAKAIADAVSALVEKKDPEIVKDKTTISIVKKSNIKTIKAGGKKLKKTKNFTVKTKATSGAKTTYKKVTKGKISVSKAGKVTLKKGLKKGKYNIKVKVSCAETATAKAAEKTITLKITVK